MGGQLSGELEEGLGSFSIKREGNAIPLLVKEGVGMGHMLPGEVGLFFDKEPLDDIFPFEILHVLLDDEARGEDRLTLVDLRDQSGRVGMDLGKLEFGHALQLLTGRLDLSGIEPRDLDKDALRSLRGNDRFTDPELVNTLTDDLDRLLEHVGSNLLTILRNQLQQEGSTSTQIETKADFLVWRRCRINTEEEEQSRQDGTKPALLGITLRGEVPGKETEQ